MSCSDGGVVGRPYHLPALSLVHLLTKKTPPRGLMRTTLCLVLSIAATAAGCGGNSGSSGGSGGRAAASGGAAVAGTGGTGGAGPTSSGGTSPGGSGGAPTGGPGGTATGGTSSGGTTASGGTAGTAAAGSGAAGAGTGGQETGGQGTGGPAAGGFAGTAALGGSRATAGVGGGGGTSGIGGSGVTETLHFSGRWNVQNGGRATTVSSGSYVVAQFTGTGITAKFDVSANNPSDLPTVAWRVDGATAWNVAEVASSLSLGSGLSNGTHTITLIARGLDENMNRWSPPLTSSLSFLGFTVAGGSLQATLRPTQPKLEILGDSITEGVIVQGASYMGHSGQCWVNDAVYSYPTQTGRMLNADYRQVGFGFQGLLKGGDGGVPAANDSFNWFYKDAPRDSWQADMVVINQGTNDSGQPGSTFKSAYATFVSTIRTAYPKAKILAMRPFNGAQAAQIQAAVTAANTAGDSRVYYVDTTGWLGTSDFSDALHPNVQGSGKAATQLVAAIQKLGLP